MPSSRGCLTHQLFQVAQQFVRIEARAEVLHPQDTVAVDQRREKSVVNVSAGVLSRENSVLLLDVENLSRRAREKRPARRLCPVGPGIPCEDLRCIAFRVGANRHEEHVRTEVRAQLYLET